MASGVSSGSDESLLHASRSTGAVLVAGVNSGVDVGKPARFSSSSLPKSGLSRSLDESLAARGLLDAKGISLTLGDSAKVTLEREGALAGSASSPPPSNDTL